MTPLPPAVTSVRPAPFQFHVGIRLAAALAMLAVAGCSNTAGANTHGSLSPSALASPSPAETPSESPSAAPSPSPSPSPAISPAVVPSWAALHSSCSGAPTAQEALITLQGSSHPVLADVTDPVHPKTICTISGGSWTPQLVTQGMISWFATQGSPGSPGLSVIATLDMFSGTGGLAASWTGGGFLDGLLAWSPDQSSTLVYITSDATAVNVHVTTGAGDRVLATYGAVSARGVNPNEDDAFIGFSPDGAYFALAQTFTGGDHLTVWNRSGVVFTQSNATMVTWGSTGSKLYFRQPNASVIYVWDSAGASGNRSPAFGQQFVWIRPRNDAGDDYLAFTVRDTSGIPHVYLYGHGGRAGGQLPNERSTPSFLNSATVFLVEEASCGSSCGIGPSTQPDGKTFTYSIATQTETASTITSVLGAWPRPGQS